jgi:Ni2+-binding GTPase involved in maturation of urease and hydrogenase
MKNDMKRIAPQVKQISMSVRTGEGISELVDDLLNY